MIIKKQLLLLLSVTISLAASLSHANEKEAESTRQVLHILPSSTVSLHNHSLLQQLWGDPAENSIVLGMWSLHFIDNDDSYRIDHQLIGFSRQGYYGGTFVNSRDDRVWTIGIQRDIYHRDFNPVVLSLGYRAGMMYGYKSMQIGNSRLFPLFQVYTNLSYKWTGIQLSWAGSVFTAGFLVKF